MKNLSIWAWMPEDYNPQGKQLSFMQIRQQVQFFGFEPKSLSMSSPLGSLALEISDWAREEQREGNTDEALSTYSGLYNKTEERGCFYIEYLPDDNFHEFHAMLIETATQKSLIVLSDFSEAVFYPDGTSEPAMAFQAIQESRDEEIQASSNAMRQTLDDFLGEGAYGYVENEQSLKSFVHLILKDYLNKKDVKYNLKYNLKKTCVEIEWYDCKININIFVSFYQSTGIIIDDGYTIINPNKTYEKDFLIYKNTPNGWIKEFIKKTESLSYSWRGEDTFLENPKFVEVRKEGNNRFTTYKFYTNRIFYEYICLHLDTLFNFLNGKQSFFDLINQLYDEQSDLINPFQVFGNYNLEAIEEDEQRAIFLAGKMKREISYLYLVNHPQTWDIFKQVQENNRDYISQQSPKAQAEWQRFIQDTTEQLNHGLNSNNVWK